MRLNVFILSLSLLMFFSIACKSARQSENTTVTTSSAPENYPNLTSKAKEISDAFSKKDYLKALELTYPKVIEIGGGRDKMIATMKEEIKKMEAEGVSLLSAVPGSPTQFVHESGSIYAVVPMTLKMKTQSGTYQADATLIGISPDAGASWTFIDAAGEDDEDLKVLPQTVLGKLKLPPDMEPVKIAN
jgi:hypothetical protein